MKLITEFGIIDCEENLNKIPKYVLQSVLNFLKIECGRSLKKKDLCLLITEFKKLETQIRSKKLKKIPLTEFFNQETQEERKHRFKGGKINEKEWKIIQEKCKNFLHKN